VLRGFRFKAFDWSKVLSGWEQIGSWYVLMCGIYV
jgi:hypothetical protein